MLSKNGRVNGVVILLGHGDSTGVGLVVDLGLDGGAAGSLAVTLPFELTVATRLTLEDQVTFWVLPLSFRV